MDRHRPKIVCLCGSTRFSEAFRQANLSETLLGNIVLTVGCIGGGLTEVLKRKLDDLHKRKIDLCDEILVLNVCGYIGSSTKSEIAYAKRAMRKIRYLEPLKSVEQLSLELCYAIEERTGPSKDSTDCAILASQLHSKIQASPL